jgi:hypothetical protein
MDIITIAGIVFSFIFVGFVVYSRRTNARQNALDKKANRDEIKAARKRMSIKTENSDGINNPLLLTVKRDKWFTVFLYFMIAVLLFLVINNIVVMIKYDITELSEIAKGFMIIKIILNIFEICMYVLFLFKMKKKIVKIYVIFMIANLLISIFTLDVISVIRIISMYFVFQSQWHTFE